MNHQGIVTCRGMLIENKVYKRGDTLTQEHYDMIMRLFRWGVDFIDKNGWISFTGGHVNLVMFASEQPAFLQGT